MPSPIHQLAVNPGFQKLSPQDQQTVLSRFHPDVANLSLSDIPYVVQGLQKQALSRPDLADPASYLAPSSPRPPEPWGLGPPSGQATPSSGRALVPALGGGVIGMDVPQGDAAKFQQAYQTGQTQGGIAGLSGVGAAMAPELMVPGSTGAGLTGYATNVLGRAALAGGGATLGTSTGQALSGQNPFAAANLQQSLQGGAYTGALAAPLEAIGLYPSTKGGRAAVNLSLGAKARDVTYGNPARGILDEGITSPTTGDFEAYKQMLRQPGATQADAAQAAGGRVAAVNQRINQVASPLNTILGASNARIPVADAIDTPLNNALNDIINNPAMTGTLKNEALNHLGELQQSLHGPPLSPGATTMSPAEAQTIKQAVGDRVNWGGNVAIGDEVRPAYRALYGSLKDSIHNAVPGSAALDERLSNLLAAHSDLMSLSKAEEVGAGTFGGGRFGSGLLRTIESAPGRFPVPQMGVASSPAVIGSLGTLSQAPPEVQQAARYGAGGAALLGYGIVGRRNPFRP